MKCVQLNQKGDVMKKLALSVWVSAIVSLPVFAVDDTAIMHDKVPANNGWGWHVYLESLAIDSETAKKEGIGDNASALGLNAEYLFGGTSQSIKFGTAFMQYSDKQKFSQTTVQKGGYDDGRVEDKSSDASAMQIFADYGTLQRFGPHKGGYYNARAGFAVVIGSERGISNCTNCASQDIDVSGGLYGLLGLGVNFTQGFSMELNYKPYFSGDIKSAIQLNFRWAY
jgi:hypothetical protein